jgi:hypothetical protein
MAHTEERVFTSGSQSKTVQEMDVIQMIIAVGTAASLYPI